MKFKTANDSFLLLEDGTLLEGLPFGYRGTVFGEVVFNTGMTGYQEVLTDPSYYGQLVTFTYPELGNTGVNPDDQESSHPVVKGVIARQVAQEPANWRATDSFHDWLESEKTVGISGLDTRALVRHLREFGSMNGAISTDSKFSPEQLLEEIKKRPSIQGANLAQFVSTKKPYEWNSPCPVKFDQRLKIDIKKRFKVVAIDFGIKRSILHRLSAHGCEIIILPCHSSISDVLSHKPEGIFFSNGPGDPAAVEEGISLAKRLISETKIPIFGICLGHQIIGLALGGRTFKLPYGHRGLNHPCGLSGRVEITSQNHGFALDAHSLNKNAVDITHFNLNDKTVAGISLRDSPVFGVQYHPEASPGPHDADPHFQHFVSLMKERRSTVVERQINNYTSCDRVQGD